MGPKTGSSGQYPLGKVGRLMNIRRRLTTKVMLTGTAVVRNRMPGGVGGRREQSRLLPDSRRIWFEYIQQASPLKQIELNHP